MTCIRSNLLSVAIAVVALAMPALALGQGATSTVTGRATDSSEGALPGVTVSISSPNLIGGARSSVTDEHGIYRFTQLPARASRGHRPPRWRARSRAQPRSRSPCGS